MFINLFVGSFQACPGMSNILQNKAPISPGVIELFFLFVACIYTSMEVTVLSCRFRWVCSCMPKVI